MRQTKRSVLAGLAGAIATTVMPREVMAEDSATKPALSNPNATSEATALYRYLNDIYGTHTLTGQQESIWRQPDGPRYELNYIRQVSGKLPAVLGLDYIDPADRRSLNDRAANWYLSEGGIATICWHWGNPLVGPGYEQSKIYFNAYEALKPGTPEHAAMMRDMAEIADRLSELQARGVPVLWRPYHEFTGDWFWWGKCGAKVFKQLWITMHDYFTKERGLNNLIWVLGYTKQVDPAYFPGRLYVDIVGADDYVQDHGPLKGMFSDVKKLGLDMPIALHECGPIPDPDQLKAADATWLYFLTWHSEFIHDGKTNPVDFIRRVYNSDWYLTKDELPNLRTYGS